MNIVHFSITPLAGAPIRLVNAICKHTEHTARLIVLESSKIFEEDIVFGEQTEEACTLAERADIIHMHNYVHLDSTAFAPIDFRALHKKGVAVLRHFHSQPATIIGNGKMTSEQVFDRRVPSLVIAQFQERFYPEACVVPNIVPQNDKAYLPSGEPGKGIFFGPSTMRSLWESRWDTKGAPDVMRILAKLRRRTGVPVTFMNGRPLTEVMQAKREAAIVIDDIVTGSYHLAGLEGLCLGRAVLNYLDARTRRVLAHLAGTTECPFVDAHISHAYETLEELVAHPEVAAEAGAAARRWVEQYWNDQSLVRHFEDVYAALLQDPKSVCRQEALRLDGKARRFYSISLPEIASEERRNQLWRSLGLVRRNGVRLMLAWERIKPTVKSLIGHIRWFPWTVKGRLYRPPTMAREQITDVVATMEQLQPVETYTAYGIHTWPLLRLSACAEVYAGRKHPADLFSRFLRKKGRTGSASKIQDPYSESQLEPGDQACEAVILTHPNRVVLRGEKHYHYIADSLREMLGKQGHRASIWEMGCDARAREYAPLRIQSSLRKEVRALLQSAPRERGMAESLQEPEWFRAFASQLVKKLGLKWSWPHCNRSVREVLAQSIVFERWLQSSGCKALFLDCWYIPSSMAAILAASRLGITTIDFQHGSQGEGHYAYSHWENPMPGGRELFPDIFWTWGRHDANQLLSSNRRVLRAENIVAGGNLWLNQWRDGVGQYEQAEIQRAKALTKGYSKTILVTLQYAIGLTDELCQAIAASPKDWLWLIRLHRQMIDQRGDIEKTCRSLTHPGINIAEATDLPLYALFQAVDAHVTWYSTCANEALAFGLPSVLLHPTGAKIFHEQIKQGVMMSAQNPKELPQALDHCETIAPQRCLEASAAVFAPADNGPLAIAAIMDAQNAKLDTHGNTSFLFPEGL